VSTLLTTHQVARLLAVSYGRLYRLVWLGRIPSPDKLGTGDFVWTAADVQRARAALATPPPRKAVAGV
jgi:excisionase family DNA binding protein